MYAVIVEIPSTSCCDGYPLRKHSANPLQVPKHNGQRKSLPNQESGRSLPRSPSSITDRVTRIDRAKFASDIMSKAVSTCMSVPRRRKGCQADFLGMMMLRTARATKKVPMVVKNFMGPSLSQGPFGRGTSFENFRVVSVCQTSVRIA